MVYVKIEIAREAITIEQKQALIKGVTGMMKDILHKDPESTFVVIQEYDGDNWGHAGEKVSVKKKGYDC